MSISVFRCETIVPHGNHFFSSVASYRRHVLGLQSKHRATYPSTVDKNTDVIIEGDVVYVIDVPRQEPSFPGVLNGLNVGFVARFGIFKGISGIVVKIPTNDPMVCPTLPRGTFYTTNYTDRLIPKGAFLVLGEQPVAKKDSSPLVRSHTCSEKRVVACLRVFNSFRAETMVHVQQAFELLDTTYETWEMIPGNDTTNPPSAAASFYLFKLSVKCHFPHIREETMLEYYKCKGAVPLRVKRSAKRFYPNDFNLQAAFEALTVHPITGESCIAVDTANALILQNNAFYWTNVLMRRHVDSLHPMSVVDESKIISIPERDDMKEAVTKSMTYMSINAMQADIGDVDVGNESSIRGVRLPQIPPPVNVKTEFDWTRMRKICACSISNDVPPGGQFKIRVFY